MNALQEDGYIIFRNAIDPSLLKQCFVGDNKANYKCVQKFIKNHMLQYVNNHLGWKCDYIKFRLSNNNNSSDASIFHRDIIPQTNQLVYQPFTCLTYLDSSEMYVIPESHKTLASDSFMDHSMIYTTRKKIHMNPGDILLFYSTLIHCGIFTNVVSNRRLLQVFEVFPTTEQLDDSLHNSLHVKGHTLLSNLMINISKNELLISSMSFASFINSFSGYGSMGFKHISYLSSEGMRPRLEISGKAQDLNYYIMNKKTNDMDPSFYYYLVCFYKYYIIFVLMIVLFVLSLCLFMKLLWIVFDKIRRLSITTKKYTKK